jgi:hypothetical protein
MKTSGWVGCMALSLLAACSGGGSTGSGGGTGGGGTVVTPTPSPSASSSPSPSYPLFSALVGDQNYPSACAGISPRGDRAGIPTVAPDYLRTGGMISYAAANQTYTVYTTTNARNDFVPADRDLSAPANMIAFAKPSVNTPGTERFQIAQPAPGGVPSNYSRFAFMDMSGGVGSGNVARSTNYCVLGVPTLTSDVPPPSVVDFVRFAVSGEAQDSSSGHLVVYSLAKSSAALRVDLNTGRFTLTLNLIGTNGGTDRDLGTFSSTNDIDQTRAAIFGTANLGGAPAPGISPLIFAGGFFGPQGREFGYAFSRQSSTNGDVTLAVAGTVIGAR